MTRTYKAGIDSAKSPSPAPTHAAVRSSVEDPLHVHSHRERTRSGGGVALDLAAREARLCTRIRLKRGGGFYYNTPLNNEFTKLRHLLSMR